MKQTKHNKISLIPTPMGEGKTSIMKVTLRQAKKAINDYIKLAGKEEVIWKKRCKEHEKKLLQLCDVYIKIIEENK